MRLRFQDLSTQQRWVVSVAAALTFATLLYLLFGSYGSAAAMSVYHIVAFKLSSPSNLPTLTSRFLSLEQDCHLNGKRYIKSVRGGKQTSPEPHHGGMQVVFVAEFASQEDLEYYVFKDPAHDAFKTGIKDLGVDGVTVLDFTDGVWPS